MATSGIILNKWVNGTARLICAALICLIPMTTAVNAGNNSWSKTLTVDKGDTVEIQTMYNITNRGRGKHCHWDNPPPAPHLRGKIKFGEVTYRAGKTLPRKEQCTDVEIDANFANYTAGNVSGVDKFTIKWRSKNGSVSYIVRYIIRVN